MKNLLLLLMFIPFLGMAQYPINESFNSGAPGWTFTNGAGIQANYAATFNINTTEYPPNSNVEILSPLYDFSDCATLQVDFSWLAAMPDGNDIWMFEYWDGSSWVTVDFWSGQPPLTGWINESYLIPAAGVTQFRFLLVTNADGPIRYYKNNGTWSYTQGGGYNTPVNESSQYWAGGIFTNFVDIDFFNIDCAEPLPVEMATFDGDCDHLYWETLSETNSSHWTVESTLDGTNWADIGVYIPALGNSQSGKLYATEVHSRNHLQYYRLIQHDINGDSEVHGPISIHCEQYYNSSPLEGVYDMMGKRIGDNINSASTGIYFLRFEDGTSRRVYVY